MPFGSDVYPVPLTPGSSEYQKVMGMFQTTVPGVNILKIERIQNPVLFRGYMVKKQKIDKDVGGNGERQLFHGTDGTNITKINTQGFNRSYAGKHGECKFIE